MFSGPTMYLIKHADDSMSGSIEEHAQRRCRDESANTQKNQVSQVKEAEKP